MTARLPPIRLADGAAACTGNPRIRSATSRRLGKGVRGYAVKVHFSSFLAARSRKRSKTGRRPLGLAPVWPGRCRSVPWYSLRSDRDVAFISSVNCRSDVGHVGELLVASVSVEISSRVQADLQPRMAPCSNIACRLPAVAVHLVISSDSAQTHPAGC